MIFPFQDQDITAIGNQIAGFSSHIQMLLYKVSVTVNPNPGLGLSGATTANTKVYSYITANPTLTRWTYATSGITRFARFLVNSFSGGSGLGTSSLPLRNDLVLFEAKKENASVRISWEMEDEKSVANYIIKKCIISYICK